MCEYEEVVGVIQWSKTKPVKDMKQPTLTSQDKHGNTWEFFPNEGKWVAHVAGKKMYSKDYSKLRERVNEAVFLAKKPEAEKKSTLPPVSSDPKNVLLIGINKPMSSNFSFEPVLARVGWNAAKGVHEVLGYRTGYGKNQTGWQRSCGNSQWLINPQELSRQDRKSLEQIAFYQLATELFDKAVSGLASRWWGQKEVQFQLYERDATREGLRLTIHEGGMSRMTTYASSFWPTLYSPGMASPQWKQDDEGNYVAQASDKSVFVKMIAGDYYPQFDVYISGIADPVYSHRDFNHVMNIAAATLLAVDNKMESITEWRGNGKWEDQSRMNIPNWPSLHKVHGGAIIRGGGSQGGLVSMTLDELLEHPLMKKTSYGYEKDRPKLYWRELKSLSGKARFGSAGQEDEILSVLAEMEKFVRQIFVDREIIRPLKEGELFTQGSYSPSAIQKNNIEETLASAVSQLEDQDEDRNLDPGHFLLKFNQQFQRIVNQVQRSEEFTSFAQQIETFSSKASKILDSTQVSHRKPSP